MMRGRIAASATGAAVLATALVTGGCSGGSADSAASPPASAASTAGATASSAASALSSPESQSPTASAGSPTPASPSAPPSSGPVSPTPTAGRDVVTSAAQKLAAAGTGRFTLKVAVSAQGKSQTITSNGVENFAAKRARATTTIGGTSVETRTLGGTTYTKLPPGAGPKGKPWVKVDTSTASGTGDLSNPNQSLAALKAGLGPVKRLGTAQIAGVPTTRYATSIDVAGAARSNPAFTQLAQLGVTTVPLEVSIDKQGRLRGLTERFRATKFPLSERQTGPAAITVSITYTDFGIPVTVTAPPASQVTVGPPTAA